MRFLPHGPSIPDDLLLARDQGRVIFFCGAGVSRARANLPDFFGLARSVISTLGVEADSPAVKLIREAQEIESRVGVAGVISADRIFGLLERDFRKEDIEHAVAASLKPSKNSDLTAHRILLDLATTSSGAVQLVTTNFDRLFEDCGRKINFWQPPRLPDPMRPDEINGIIYLHGRANPDYTSSEGDGFILSSSEFGRAYLSDGWATNFIREIIRKYVVVFVGYSADDPPVQYLLEALRKTTGKLEATYAFQFGDQDEAAARWRHKGVQSIHYSASEGHAALWTTLEAWADRARNPDEWHTKIIEAARRGPSALQAHERGQIAHVVSTNEGAKKFFSGENPLSADWLCVFDRQRRFAKPGGPFSFRRKGPYVDPFDLYGLDSDVPPTKIDEEDHYTKREVPTNAWDAFEINHFDRPLVRDEHLASLRGQWAAHSPRLVPRIGQLGVWLAEVCDQPAAIWWAAHQSSIHKSILNVIIWRLKRSEIRLQPQIRKAWSFLIDSWTKPENDFYDDWYALKDQIENSGWSEASVRSLGQLLRPRLLVEHDTWGGPTPPPIDEKIEDITQLMRLDVRYPDMPEKLDVPDPWVGQVVRVLRQNLEVAVSLENEIGKSGLSDISPIHVDDEIDNGVRRTFGISAHVIQYCDFFSQLAALDKQAARREFDAWPTDEDSVFARLRIWASGKSAIVPDKEFVSVIESLSDSAFWNVRHQRDLLLVIKARWRKIDVSSRRAIEQRLLVGPKRWRGEKAASFQRRKDWMRLDRFHWLIDSGCAFSRNLRSQLALIHASVPDWSVKSGEGAADSLEGRSGWVQTNLDHTALSDTPLPLVLSRAQELSGRSDNFLVENDPFAGLVAKSPVRALRALTYAAKRSSFPEWAWRRFLSPSSRKSDSDRFSKLLGERISGYPEENVALFLRSATDWFCCVSENLTDKCFTTFDKCVVKLISILESQPDLGISGLVRNPIGRDWATEAINSPSGKIAEALLNDLNKRNLTRETGLPDSWMAHAERILRLRGDLRRYSLVIFSRNINWLYYVDPSWSKDNLLNALRGDDNDDRDAAWSGFLWGAVLPSKELFIQTKSEMLAFALDPITSRRSFVDVIAGFVLAGWGSTDEDSGDRYITDEEMRNLLLRSDDEFRIRTLWHLQRWSGEDKDETQKKWSYELQKLLTIWPRQISVKSDAVSARLCELAFESNDHFPVVAPLVIPLISKMERGHLMLPELRRPGSSILERFPKLVLDLLYAVLSENAIAWPFGMEEILQRIGKCDSALNVDEKLIELRHRWDSR
jgi:SIR2-like domain